MNTAQQGDLTKKVTELESRISLLERMVGNLAGQKIDRPLHHVSQTAPSGFQPPTTSGPKLTEIEIGQKWLSVVGVILLFLGIVFFISYVFRYIGPAGKVGLSYAVAIGLALVSILTKKRSAFFSGIVAAGAWGVTYLTTYAMYFFETTRLITSPALEVTLLTIVAGALLAVAYAQRSRPLVVLGVVLGFLTMIVSPLSLFSITGIVLMTVIATILAIGMPWGDFLLPTSLGAFVAYYFWFAAVDLLDKNRFGLVAVMMIWLIITIGVLLRRDPSESLEGQTDVGTLIITTVATTFFSWLAIHRLLIGHERFTLAVVLFVLGGLHLVMAWLMHERQAKAENSLTLAISGLVLGMAGLFYIFVADSVNTSIAWAVLGLSLVVVGVTLKRPTVIAVAVLPFLGSLLRYVMNDLYLEPAVSSEISLALYVGIMNSLAMVGAALIMLPVRKLLQQKEQSLQHLPGCLLVFALFILLAMTSHEFTGAVPTVLWGVIGLAVVILGFAMKWKDGRLVGLLTLALTVLRMFAHDLSGLELLPRVVSFMVLGGILLLLGYGYSHNQEKLQKLLEEE